LTLLLRRNLSRISKELSSRTAKKKKFINDLKGAIGNINTFNISDIELLEKTI